MFEKLTDKLIDEVAYFKEQEIVKALTYAMGCDFKLTDEIVKRGEFILHTDGREEFKFDGISLLSFHPVEISFAKVKDGYGSQLNVSRTFMRYYETGDARYGEFRGDCRI